MPVRGKVQDPEVGSADMAQVRFSQGALQKSQAMLFKSA